MELLDQYIAEGEHSRQDFKFRIDEQKKIARTLCAFANTDGGRLLIGVKDNGKIVGVDPQEEFFMIEGSYQIKDKSESVVCSLKRGNKKVVKRNGKAYEKFSEHIGYLPLVIISPGDSDLIVEGSDTRRKFMDNVISQSDKLYLQSVIKYNKVLTQRNSLLKYFAANRTFDALNLKVYNEQLESYGTIIFKKRTEFLEAFIPILRERYAAISSSKEQVNLVYKTQLE